MLSERHKDRTANVSSASCGWGNAAPGHDGIRAGESQSLKAASKATIVLGFSPAGPTCVAITSIVVAVPGRRTL
jgi:hypothetical protein